MTTETLSQTIQRTIYEEIVAETPFLREEFVECLVHSICDKLQDAINDYDPVEETERAFQEASEKMGW